MELLHGVSVQQPFLCSPLSHRVRDASSPEGGSSDDRRQWRKQGEAAGAAASRMQARAEQPLGAATRVRSTHWQAGKL